MHSAGLNKQVSSGLTLEMARLVLRRYSILPPYPYHYQPRSQHFPDFPLQFRSPRPPFFYSGNSEFLTGAIAAFHTLLTIMAQPTASDYLDSLVEWNLSQRVKDQLTRLKSEGFHAKLVGDAAKTEAVAMHVHYISGSLLPFRNLNLPVTEYNHFPHTIRQTEFHQYLIKKFESVKGVKKLIDLDLKELNKRQGGEKELEIKRIQSGLKLLPLMITTVDVGIVSRHKLWISNSSGELLDGNSSSEVEEFHTLRLEKVIYRPFGLLRWLPPFRIYQQWLEKQLMELTQWTISDVDGYMGGNPLTK